MTTEQIKQEKKNFTDWFKNQTECDINIEPESVIAFSAWKAAKEHAAEQGGWISVEEKLPEYRQKIIVACKDGCVYEDIYDEEEKLWINCRASPVTHWQPLPAPPGK